MGSGAYRSASCCSCGALLTLSSVMSLSRHATTCNGSLYLERAVVDACAGQGTSTNLSCLGGRCRTRGSEKSRRAHAKAGISQHRRPCIVPHGKLGVWSIGSSWRVEGGVGRVEGAIGGVEGVAATAAATDMIGMVRGVESGSIDPSGLILWKRHCCTRSPSGVCTEPKRQAGISIVTYSCVALEPLRVSTGLVSVVGSMCVGLYIKMVSA